MILEVDRKTVYDAPSLQKALSEVPAGRSVIVWVHQPGGGGRNQYLVLERERAP